MKMKNTDEKCQYCLQNQVLKYISSALETYHLIKNLNFTSVQVGLRLLLSFLVFGNFTPNWQIRFCQKFVFNQISSLNSYFVSKTIVIKSLFFKT